MVKGGSCDISRRQPPLNHSYVYNTTVNDFAGKVTTRSLQGVRQGSKSSGQGRYKVTIRSHALAMTLL